MNALAEEQKKVSNLALASIICGIAGLFVFGAGIAGLITGIMVLRNNKPFPISSRDKGFAITGVVTGAASILFAILSIIFVILIVVGAIAVFSQLPSLANMG